MLRMLPDRTKARPQALTAQPVIWQGSYVSTKQENVNISKERVHKSEECVHEPVAYWNGKDGFIRADHAQYVSSWSDYYPKTPLRITTQA